MKTITAYTHPPLDPARQEPDSGPGPYYVSARDGPTTFWLLAGPFATHAEALALVERTRQVACEDEPRAFWYSFGTCRMKDGTTKPGSANHVLGIKPTYTETAACHG